MILSAVGLGDASSVLGHFENSPEVSPLIKHHVGDRWPAARAISKGLFVDVQIAGVNVCPRHCCGVALVWVVRQYSNEAAFLTKDVIVPRRQKD